jgi:hypothetical protein
MLLCWVRNRVNTVRLRRARKRSGALSFFALTRIVSMRDSDLAKFRRRAAIADTLRFSRLSVPVLVQATLDIPAKMSIAHRRDSFCGKMSACNNLKQYGIPYSLTSLHTVSPDSEEFKRTSHGSQACAAW